MKKVFHAGWGCDSQRILREPEVQMMNSAFKMMCILYFKMIDFVH